MSSRAVFPVGEQEHEKEWHDRDGRSRCQDPIDRHGDSTASQPTSRIDSNVT